MASCESCPLGRRGKYVPTHFPVTPPDTNTLAFIGEAPAKNEVRMGEPFVGPSGRLLNAVLDHYGTRRTDVLLTNAASCHYPDDTSDEDKALAIACCRPRLNDDLRQAAVGTAVLMGNSAVQAVLPHEEARKGVMKLRAGPPKRRTVPDVGEMDIVPTFHPAACMRNQAQFPLMLDDVGKAIAEKKPDLWYEPSIIVIEDAGEARQVLQRIHETNSGGPGVVVDTESGRDKDTSFGRDDGPYGRVLCVGIGPMDPEYGDTVYVFTDDAIRSPFEPARSNVETLRNLLNDVGLIAQNGKYDIGVLMNYLEQDYPFPLRFDTMLASYCMNENGGIHGLKYMGQEILHTPDWDSVIKPFITKKEGYGAIPKDMLHKYNAFDVHVTRLLYGYFLPFLEQRELTRLNNFLTQDVSYMLTQVEARGLGFDMEKSKELEAEYEEEQSRIDETLPLNPRSPKQIQEYFEHAKLYNPRDPECEPTDISLPNTGEDTLKFLLERHGEGGSHPSLRIDSAVESTVRGILASRKVSKLKGTYVTGIQSKVTGRGTVHPSFLIHGTNTGRLSSRNPNAQNIPRSGEIKKQFIPAHPGWKMVQLDFSQAELRVLTWLSQEPYLQSLFNDPSKDVFVELCRSMFSNFDTLPPDDAKEIRTLIKTFAYGISYGRTPEGIAADPAFNMSVETATQHYNAFRERIPNVFKFMQEKVIDEIHAGHDLVNPFGRHKRFWLLTDMNKDAVEREAMSFFPQSTASDICLTAAVRANRQGIYIVNLVHDAIIFEAPADEAHEQAAFVDKLMVQAAHDVVGDYVAFRTDYDVGNNWYDVK